MLGDYTKEQLLEMRKAKKVELDKRIREFESKADMHTKKLFRWCPDTYKEHWMNACEGKASPKQAIKMFCLECVGWSRGEVARCPAKCCPLYALRPFKE